MGFKNLCDDMQQRVGGVITYPYEGDDVRVSASPAKGKNNKKRINCSYFWVVRPNALEDVNLSLQVHHVSLIALREDSLDSDVSSKVLTFVNRTERT